MLRGSFLNILPLFNTKASSSSSVNWVSEGIIPFTYLKLVVIPAVSAQANLVLNTLYAV